MSKATARNDARPPASGRRGTTPRITGEFVRDVDPRRSGELTLGGLIESGVTLARLYESELFGRFRPAVRLRFVHDALESLAVLQLNPRLEAAHPDLVITPRSVVIGLDGAARVNIRLARETTAGGSRLDIDTGSSHELRQAASRAGVRPDVYSFGILAWEALRGKPLEPALRRHSEALSKELSTLDIEEEWMMHFVELSLAALGVSPNGLELSPRALMGMLTPAVDALAPRQQIAESVQGIQSVTALCALHPKPPSPSHCCHEETDRRTPVRLAKACDVREEEACSPSTQRRPLQVATELAQPLAVARTTPMPSSEAITGEQLVTPARKVASPKPSANGARCLLLLILLAVVGVAAGLFMRLFIGLT